MALTVLALALVLVGLNLYPHLPWPAGTIAGEPHPARTVEETTRRSIGSPVCIRFLAWPR